MAILSKKTLYAYYIGINHDNKLLNLRPVDFFFWELLKWCNVNGVQYYNWMGAGNKNKSYGVRDFKVQFGGDLFEPGRMSKYNNRFVKILIKPLYTLWKKLN